MSEYKVIRYFTDLQDNNYAYHVGDIYPREGIDPKPSRIAELSSASNRRGTPLIELVKDNKAKAKVAMDDVKPIEVEADTAEVTEDVEAEEKPVAKKGRPKKKSE